MTTTVSQPRLLNSYEAILSLEEMSFTEKIDCVKAGFTKEQLTDMKEVFELDWISICRMLHIADRTLYIKKGEKKFNQTVSDRILAIAEVYSLGYTMFEDQKKFNNWMKRKNDYLLGQSPVEIMACIPGIEEVKMEIRRIAFGIS